LPSSVKEDLQDVRVNIRKMIRIIFRRVFMKQSSIRKMENARRKGDGRDRRVTAKEFHISVKQNFTQQLVKTMGKT
jgi:hypothetical protein